MATDFKAGDKVTWQASFGQNVYVGTVSYATKATVVVEGVVDIFEGEALQGRSTRFSFRKVPGGFYPEGTRATGNTGVIGDVKRCELKLLKDEQHA